MNSPWVGMGASQNSQVKMASDPKMLAQIPAQKPSLFAQNLMPQAAPQLEQGQNIAKMLGLR